MIVLRIEHPVPNYEGWKKAFDNDPINRKKAGVKRYTISRPTDDPNYVMIDLEFDNPEQAEHALSALKKLWEKVEGKVMMNPKTRILDLLEIIDL